jgi:glycosyltransferase involved in cell wall biosynthesis
MTNILHTEASNGWGGQEIRTLKEAIGMRERGHTIIFAVVKGGQLVNEAKNAGFIVYEIPFARKDALRTFKQIRNIIRSQQIDIVNTHSSWDSWIAGIAARSARVSIIRTRHLSTNIHPGWNSRVLYGWLADHVVTTCQYIAEVIQKQAPRSSETCQSIPTGVDPSNISVSEDDIAAFRKKYNINSDDFIIGTACVLRSWKGINTLLDGMKELEDLKHVKCLIVGGGPCEKLFREQSQGLGIENQVIFTGHLKNPFPAIAAMDVFTLLSTAHEGVSQASLQAAYLERPLVTTRTGGLAEVCIDGKTGFNIQKESSDELVQAIRTLAKHPNLCKAMGKEAKNLVCAQFTWEQTLNRMEKVYEKIHLKKVNYADNSRTPCH